MNIKKLLLKGSFYRTLNILINMGVSLYIMPFLIHGIGERSYGMWLLVSSILGQFGLLELGFGRANQHSIINALEKNDEGLLNRSVSTALAIYLILASVSILIVFGVVGAAPIFFEAAEEAKIFQLVVAIQGLQAALEFPIMSTRGILVAKLRYDVISYLQIAKVLGRTALIILIVGQSGSLLHLSLITFGSELIVYIITFCLAWRFCPRLKISHRFVKFSEATKLFNFGKWVFLITLGDKFKHAIPNYVIAGTLSLGVLSHYAVADRLFRYTGSVIGSMLNIFFPVFAKFFAQDDLQKLAKKYRFSMRITMICSVVAYGLLFLLGQIIILWWMGESFMDATVPLLALCVAGFFLAPIEQSLSLLYAMNKHRLYSIVNIFDMLLTLVMCLILTKYFGLVGIAVGYGIPVALKFIAIEFILNGLLERPKSRTFFQLSIFFGHAFGLLFVCAWIGYYYLTPSPIGAVAGVSLFLGFYPLSAFYFQLNHSERMELFHALPLKLQPQFIKRLI